MRLNRKARVSLRLAVILCAACSSGGADLEGRYSGDGVVLTLKKQGGPLYNGALELEKKRYPIVLKVKGRQLRGRFEGEGGHNFEVRAKVKGTSLELTSGGKTFTLAREGAAASNPLAQAKGGKRAKPDNPLAQAQGGKAADPPTPQGGGVASTPKAPAAAGESAQRDRRLVGLWTRTEGMSSGGASHASKLYLEINGGGAFRTGTGRTVAGGAGWSIGAGSGVTITGRGRWRSAGRIVYVNSGGGWSPYARYDTTGAKLMFTFGNGRREIWYRAR